jgi:lysophospholipase L1-like esterase
LETRSNKHHFSVTKRLIPQCNANLHAFTGQVRQMRNRTRVGGLTKRQALAVFAFFFALHTDPPQAQEGIGENHLPVDICLAGSMKLPLGVDLSRSAALVRAVLARKSQRPVRIVALGSSSTRGVGASSWAATYPEVMQREIERLRPPLQVEIINLGANGETIPGQISRIESAVLPQRPDIVVWQLGANDVVMPWGGLGADFTTRIGEAVRQMQQGGADVILMDLQRTPLVMWSRTREELIALVARVARETGAGHFRRHALFEQAEAAGADASAFTSWDGLHNSDAGYDCTGRALARAIDAAWGKPRRPEPKRQPRRAQP